MKIHTTKKNLLYANTLCGLNPNKKYFLKGHSNDKVLPVNCKSCLKILKKRKSVN